MKIHALLLALFALTFIVQADVEKLEDGTLVISGTWTFWEDKDLLAPSGVNSFGEFKTILFKSVVNDYEGVRQMKKTPATFRVQARESTTQDGSKILVVEKILGPAE